MSNTLYWAVKLNEESVAKLLSNVRPKHPRVFGEHVTLIFGPSEQQENDMMKLCGETVLLIATEHVYDNKGQAVIVEGITRQDGGVPHITISCSADTKPVYSNKLVNNPNAISEKISLPLSGKISRFTKNNTWDCEKK